MKRVLVFAGALFLAACGSSTTVSDRPAASQQVARWEDAFEAMPEMLVVVRPNALKRDRVYGPVVRRVSELAAARSKAAAATRPIEAFEWSDEVIAGLTGAGDQGESVLVLRGVRADLDPAKIAGPDGVPLWKPVAAGAVAELEHTEAGTAASLFVLPGRTWVIAAGDARARVRQTFAKPPNRPKLAIDRDALFSIRFDGPALVKNVPKLRSGGALSNVGKQLSAMTIALRPGSEGVVTATFAYREEDAAAFAEVTVKHVVDVVTRERETHERFRWLEGAQVDRGDKIVTLRAKLPTSLLAELARIKENELLSPDLPAP